MSGYRNVSIGSPLNVHGTIPSINSTISKFSTKTDRQFFTAGRLFWRYGIDLWCSAAVVTSSSQDLSVAAAHFVRDSIHREWYINYNIVFIPDYSNNVRPYGTWLCRKVTALGQWLQQTDWNYDVAFVGLATLIQCHIQTFVGSQGINFNQPHYQYIYSFGYPVNMDCGQVLKSCSGNMRLLTLGILNNLFYNGQQLACNMEDGASGGPWLPCYNAFTGIGPVISVTIGYTLAGAAIIHGPYFDSNVVSLYQQAKFM